MEGDLQNETRILPIGCRRREIRRVEVRRNMLFRENFRDSPLLNGDEMAGGATTNRQGMQQPFKRDRCAALWWPDGGDPAAQNRPLRRKFLGFRVNSIREQYNTHVMS